jgi:hypothetical protein
MPRFLTRFVGLLLLLLSITLSSCQAVLQRGATINAPEQLSPGSFQNGR